ncbi:MAG TPA: DUF4239 domain-containing protein [Trebonia sp.]|nr:DUF4239 domain-containing protein [Trebonia sp.]
MSVLGRETWILLAAGAVSAGLAGVIAWFSRHREAEAEDVTIGFLGPSLAALYLLVLALALATEWQTIGTAQQAVSNEAVAVQQVYWSASGLPPAAGDTLRAQVRGYLATVLHHDWPQMEHGTLDSLSLTQLTAMSTSTLQLDTSTSSAADAQEYATGQLSALASARAARENAAESRLPVGLLAAVIATSAIVSVFPFAGGIKRARTPVSVAIVQAALVAIAVVVIFQLNNPFTGPLATSAGPLATVAAEIGVH